MRKLIYILIILLTLTSCGGGSDDPKEPELVLGSFGLTFPVNNTLCTEGTTVSNNEVIIPLRWNTSKNAASYKITIINTVSG